MRAIVIGFALLACAKVWTQDRLVRAAMSEALIQAYRERAQQVCARESSKEAGTEAPKFASTLAKSQWSAASPAEITIGGKVATVMLWDVDNPLWNVRYRNPHLVLTSTGARKWQCSYDVTAGVAFLQAL